MVIWLASYPRSGNWLTRLAFWHFFHFPTATIYNNPVGKGQIAALAGEVPNTSIEVLDTRSEPYIVKTHDFPRPDDYPAIYLVRDGRDALVSYAHYILDTELQVAERSYPNEFLRVLREIITSKDQFGGWGPHVLAWMQRKPPTATIRFEDLVADPPAAIEQAMVALGKGAPIRCGESMPTFEYLHSEFPVLFRKGKIGAWRDEMPDDLHELFWEHHREAMVQLKYE